MTYSNNGCHTTVHTLFTPYSIGPHCYVITRRRSSQLSYHRDIALLSYIAVNLEVNHSTDRE